MKTCNFFIFIFFIFISMEFIDAKFTFDVCNHDKPHIHFPFKINSSCEYNQTLISFPGYGDLIVKSISYEPKKLTLIDPKDCVFQVFLNLDLLPTPFRYYHVVRNYTYLSCSVELPHSFERVPCLSGYKHHVYVVESSSDVPGSCEVVKTVSIPFAYSSYVSDDSFGLDLTWDSDGFQSIGEELSIVILVFVIAGLAYVTTCCSKKSQSKKHEWEKLLGDLEIL
ncbi:RING-H2 finger protein ATL20-like [Cynara cardunculus var. scolymus]|uniref:RING-type E3 ubiquitin transferase n=1 Tax=Cynara cardunculus var. scolymus TaxID=59895 RepID=A0A103XJJ8_CYNCS|nr:RING-H2 finger protein ATL20-like [Cynara cardunculus var. scolymus]KVH91966.1 hypothetical protein Ccrd_005999 [Cynara cardunculus var. scolymus]